MSLYSPCIFSCSGWARGSGELWGLGCQWRLGKGRGGHQVQLHHRAPGHWKVRDADKSSRQFTDLVFQVQLHLAAKPDLGHSDLSQQGREGDGGSPGEGTERNIDQKTVKQNVKKFQISIRSLSSKSHSLNGCLSPYVLYVSPKHIIRSSNK